MNQGPLGIDGDQPAGATLGLGAGWVLPALFVALFVALFYLPAHHASPRPGEGFVAALGALYVTGLSVVLPRVARGGILRAAGSRDPIVLLGRGPDPLLTATIDPRWRLAAMGAGALLSVAAVLGSAALAEVAEEASYAHALASLAFGANIVVAVAAAVPIPGFTGWALILALVDAAGIPADQRVRRAARIAQAVGSPSLLLVGIVAALLGDLMMSLVAFLLAMFTWTRTDIAVGHDAIARFLASHVVGDVARPVASHADADEPVENLVGRLTETGVVTLVETSGALVGAIGPWQLAARDRLRRGQRCSELMVPLSNLPLPPATMSASGLMPELRRHGLALVRGLSPIAYVEAGDLLARILASAGEGGGTLDGAGRDSGGEIQP